MSISKSQLNAAMHNIRAIADAIKNLKQVPAGHLYTAVMHKIELADFEKIISILINASLVEREQSHMLK